MKRTTMVLVMLLLATFAMGDDVKATTDDYRMDRLHDAWVACAQSLRTQTHNAFELDTNYTYTLGKRFNRHDIYIYSGYYATYQGRTLDRVDYKCEVSCRQGNACYVEGYAAFHPPFNMVEAAPAPTPSVLGAVISVVVPAAIPAGSKSSSKRKAPKKAK